MLGGTIHANALSTCSSEADEPCPGKHTVQSTVHSAYITVRVRAVVELERQLASTLSVLV